MPQIQYPFIDIAVHPAVRARFAAGEAIALFSRDMGQVLWANGEGAKLFGYPDIYDLLDNGPDLGNVSFRQLASAARQLAQVGDRRGLTMRVSSGFTSLAIGAEVSLVEIRKDDVVVIFSAPVAANMVSDDARLGAMLKGFDDPDTHMAVLDGRGEILAASPGYKALGILPETVRSLIDAVGRHGDGLIKRPIASAAGYLPAAIGRLSLDPPLHLLFCVETVLGRMDPPQEASEPLAVHPPQAGSEPDDAVALGNDAPEQVADMFADLPAQTEAEPEFVVATNEFSMGNESPADEDRPVDESVLQQPEPLVEVGGHVEAERGNSDDAPEMVFEDDVSDVETPFEPDVDSWTPAPNSPGHATPVDMNGHADAMHMAPTWRMEPMPEVHVTSDLLYDDDTAEEDINDLAAIDGVTEAAIVEDRDVATHFDTAAVGGDDSLPLPAPVFQDHASDDEQERGVEMNDAIDDAATTGGQVDAVPAAEPVVEEAVGDDSQPFRFRREGRPVRFVWKLDAEGRFSEVSDEFARTVGPHAGNINGMSYVDLHHLFNLDPTNEIGQLLERRDTWSGRTIRWPVEGTDLVVPVDLAALPTYSRNREFDGFRGFGIIRVADAERDPAAIGLTLGASAGKAATEDGDTNTINVQDVDHPLKSDVDPAADTTDAPKDEFRGEVPALDMVSNPLANFSEKIIQLEERRSRGRDGLSANEQNAFREIARQLEPFGKRPNETLQSPIQDAPSSLDGDVTDGPAGVEAEESFDDDVRRFSKTDMENSFRMFATGDDAQSENGVAEDEAEDREDAVEDVEDGTGLTAAAADQIPLAILIHAGDRLIQANSEFRRLTGYDGAEALEAAGGLDALITRRDGPDGGVYMVRADASEVPVAARLQSVRYEGSTVLMLTMVPADLPASEAQTIAEDHEAARKVAALQVEVDELRSILETATDGVVVLDMDGRIKSMNRSASALFNFDESETRDKPFVMLFAHESQKAVQDYLAGLAGHGVASVLNDGREVIGREVSGGFIPLFMTMGRMAASNTYCAVIRDITQWKRSEEELKSAKRAAETANQHKSDFLARVSHEIRTPLNAIIGFSDMIASEHFGPAGHSRYVEYANDIARSGRHVLDIVNDLLDISKIESGEMDLEFAAVGINDCISEAVSLVQPQANGQRVIIRTSLSQAVPDVVADLRSIKQIAINILANAVRFTPSGGQIVVSTAYEPSGAVTLRIRDTGVGMTKAELEQAMKPFGQVSTGVRKRGDGTGLGLPLTKAMTEANRASFAIQSAPNEGTLVEITFPPQRVLAD